MRSRGDLFSRHAVPVYEPGEESPRSYRPSIVNRDILSGDIHNDAIISTARYPLIIVRSRRAYVLPRRRRWFCLLSRCLRQCVDQKASSAGFPGIFPRRRDTRERRQRFPCVPRQLLKIHPGRLGIEKTQRSSIVISTRDTEPLA